VVEAAMKQIPLPIVVETARGFDSFVTGSNAMALDHLRAIGPGSPPVYLWGPSGSGKTHLLQSLAQHLHRQGAAVAWFDAGIAPPWTAEESALVVLDACDAFDDARQQAAFALFIDATARGIAVAAAGRVPPIDLPLRDDLRTRLGWGHVLAIAPLSEAESRAALRREADRRGLFLSDEVMSHLLTRFSRDMKSLVALLDRLDRFALVKKRAITVPLLRQMLAEEGGIA
jgi:DnaA family protein